LIRHGIFANQGSVAAETASRPSQSMYSVEIDRSKRLVVISAVQHVTAEEAKRTAQQLRELLNDVAPGFRVLADFRWLESMDSAAARHVAEIMDTLAEKGVASVSRVMPDPHKDIGLNILSQFHYGPEIQIATFETLADALQSLTRE
jgi:anti-anti-sigma regulatory factor